MKKMHPLAWQSPVRQPPELEDLSKQPQLAIGLGFVCVGYCSYSLIVTSEGLVIVHVGYPKGAHIGIGIYVYSLIVINYEYLSLSFLFFLLHFVVLLSMRLCEKRCMC